MQESLDIIFKLATILAFPALAWYSWETFKLRKATERQLDTLVRPFLGIVLLGDQSKRKVKNDGSAMALNAFFLERINSTRFKISEEKYNPSGIPIGKAHEFACDKMVELTASELSHRIPSVKNLVNYLAKKEENFLAVVYEDLHGNKLCTISYGSGGAYDAIGQTDYINDL